MKDPISPEDLPQVDTETSIEDRETSGAPAPKHAGTVAGLEGLLSPLAHPSEPLMVHLNEGWRVTEDSIQWILQRRKGNPRRKNGGWRNRSFCDTRTGLLSCISENYGPVNVEALRIVHSLPEHHFDARLARTHAN
jgi:hypothetical protein